MRPLIFWIVLGLIGLSWTANSFYAHSQKLKEPIFLEQYTAIDVSEEMPVLTFYYLTNKVDRSSASAVNIGGVGAHVNGTHFSYEQDRSDLNAQTFTHHALRMMEVELHDYVLDELMQNGTFSFTTMTVFFSTGQKVEASIGEVILQPAGEEQTAMQHLSSGINSEWRDDIYQATESLKIEELKVSDHSEVKVSQREPAPTAFSWEDIPGVDYRQLKLPLTMQANDQLYVYAKRINGYWDPVISITGTTESGKPFHSGMYSSFSPQPYLTQEQVDQIIRGKHEKEASSS